MKNIIIDCRMINASGIGTYIKNLLPIIIKNNIKIKYYLLGNKIDLITYPFHNENNVEIIDCRSDIYSIKEQIDFKKIIPREIDLYWSPHYNIPIFYRGKILVSIMDVGHLALKSINKGLLKQSYAKFMFQKVRTKADAILFISEFSKLEFSKYVGSPLQPQYVTLLGVSKDWFDIDKNQPINRKPYFLFVGNVKPHKNLKRLLNAFQIVLNKIPHDLLIVGEKDGFITPDIEVEKMAKRYDGRVNFTGKVDNSRLQQYIIQSDALIFPSIYEGFGLPPLEAMAAGIPVIASNIASIPEVCGDAAIYFDPFNHEDIADKLILFANYNHKMKNGKILLGKEIAKRLTWEKPAQQTIEVMNKLIG